jgi:hypothetical protein
MEVALLFSLSCWWFSAIFPGLWRQNEATEVVDVFSKQLKTIRRAWLAVGMLKITSVALCYHAYYLDFLPGLSCYGICLNIRAQLLTQFLDLGMPL